MEKKQKIYKQVLRMPNSDFYMVSYQYGETGILINDTNNGFGYTEEEAFKTIK